MLLRIKSCEQLDERKLMDLYGESNKENVDYLYPEAEDRAEALRKVEEGFLAFLREDFFLKEEDTYWVLEENGAYVSALRLTEVKERTFYLEALETHPDHRHRGCALRLFREVFAVLGEEGGFTIWDCVSKRNTASLRAHQKAGFVIDADQGKDLLRDEIRQGEYTMVYRS